MIPAPPSPSVTERERRRSLVAAIAAITIFGLTVGQSVPLLTLLLESRGTDATVNGLNAAAPFIGVIVGPMLTPWLVRQLGIRNLLLACFAVDIVGILAVKAFDDLLAWFALRAVLGLVGSTIFTTSEVWINALAGDRARGRILGFYAAALSAGFGLGAAMLTLTGIEGWRPFVVGSLVTAVAAVPVLFVGNGASALGRDRSVNPLRMFARAPFLLFVVATFGIYETTLLNLLPVWAVRQGFSRSLAAGAVSAIYFGSIAVQPFVGWLADRVARRSVLQLCCAVGLAGATLLLAGTPAAPFLFMLLFGWGGVAGSIYPVALSMAGDRFRNGELVAVNAAFVTAYGLGSLVGPALGGAAMDLWDARGLMGLFVLLFGVFLSVTLVAGSAAAVRTSSGTR